MDAQRFRIDEQMSWRRNSNGLYNPLKGERGWEIWNKRLKKALIVLTGPTAVGKTALSIQLARRIGGEIISADSMQVYRHMDIGTAKIRLEEMDGVPHHRSIFWEPTEDFNVVRFQALARAAAEDIYSRGKIPIVAGGTGFIFRHCSMILISPRSTKYAVSGGDGTPGSRTGGGSPESACGRSIQNRRRRSTQTM